MNLFSRHQITVAVVVDVGWMGVKYKLWVQQCFIVPFILLIVIHSSKTKMEKVDGFAVVFDGVQLSQPDGKQFSNLIILCVVEV